MGKFIGDAINNYLMQIIDESVKMFLVFLTGLSSIANGVLDMPVVIQGILLAQTVALSILAPKVAYEAVMTYILRGNGDSDANPQQLILGIVKSVAIITCIPWLVRWLFLWGTTLATDVAKLPGVTASAQSGSQIESLVNAIKAINDFPLFLAIAIFFALILFIIIFIQNFLRAGELVMAAVVGCFMALGFTSGSSSFSEWFKELIAISFTQAAQMFLIKISFSSIQAIPFENKWYCLCLFIAMLFVTIKVPSTLKSYAHSTGFGRVAGGGVQQAVSSYVMRKTMMK